MPGACGPNRIVSGSDGAGAAAGPPQSLPHTALEWLQALESNPHTGLSSSQAAERIARDGANEVPQRRVRASVLFARKFWGLSAWMLELIVLLSLLLHKWADFCVALALLFVNAILSFLQERRATRAVTSLQRRLQVSARVLRDRQWQQLPARELVRGDVIRLRIGDVVPADARILDGELRVDQSALTGESREVAALADGTVYSASIVRSGEATGVVVGTGIGTYFGKTAQLVAIARPRLHVEDVISRLVSWLFVIVGVQVVLAVVLASAAGYPILEILPLSLVLLMSAIPVALPVMFTVSMALGSIELAKRGVLVTRLNAAEDAASMDIVCADKTGTLTMNRLELVKAEPRPGFTEADVIRIGALASNESDQDPIDLAFLRAVRARGLVVPEDQTIEFSPFSPRTRRTEAVILRGETIMRVMKGAIHTVAELANLGPAEVAALDASAERNASEGARILAVAAAEGSAGWRLVGTAALLDPPRPDSARLIEELRAMGVAVKMLTGDSVQVGQAVSNTLRLGDVVRAPVLRAALDAPRNQQASFVLSSGGFAEVYPEDKYLVVRVLQAAGHIVGMTGDGVNDAPALKQAEVGIAVQGSTDVAKSAASVVLTTEGLACIVDLVKNGRAIYQRVLTWIINKVSRTILKSGFVVIAFLATGKFVISALAMVLLVFMTDFVKIALSTDRVRPSQKPETWDIGPLVKVAVLLGLLMLVESLGMLAIAWRTFGLGQSNGRLHTFTFLTLLFFALCSILSIRERRAFWASRPSWLLAVALAADACLGVFLGRFGLAELHPISYSEIGFAAIGSTLLTFAVNDPIKTYLIAHNTPPGDLE